MLAVKAAQRNINGTISTHIVLMFTKDNELEELSSSEVAANNNSRTNNIQRKSGHTVNFSHSSLNTS